MCQLRAKLVIFSNPNYVVVEKKDESLPDFDENSINGQKTTKEIVKDFFQDITSVNPDWPGLIFNQSLVIESFEGAERVIDIVYSLYLEGQTDLKNDHWQYKKIEDLDENSPHYNIIREVGMKRYV